MAVPAPHRGELLLREADDRLAEHEHVAGIRLRRPLMWRRVTLLPVPDGPRMQRTSPRRILRLTPAQDVAAAVALPDFA